jgi:hypothetical protein
MAPAVEHLFVALSHAVRFFGRRVASLGGTRPQRRRELGRAVTFRKSEGQDQDLNRPSAGTP